MRAPPELPAYGTPITIRHLLHHTSGIRDSIGVLSMGGTRFDDVTTPQDALDAIVRRGQPPMVLRPLERDAFAAGPMQLRFVRAPGGATTGFTLDVGRLRGIVFGRVADDGQRRE